jgi:hypothetical protein
MANRGTECMCVHLETAVPLYRMPDVCLLTVVCVVVVLQSCAVTLLGGLDARCEYDQDKWEAP